MKKEALACVSAIKRDRILKTLLALGGFAALSLVPVQAETILLGDQRISVNNAANPAQPGNLEVDGAVSVGGTLSVEGTTWMVGNETQLGLVPGNQPRAGLLMEYDDNDGDYPHVRWTNNKKTNLASYWEWNYTKENGQVVQQMILSGEEGNSLQINNVWGAGTLILDPSSAPGRHSAFPGGVIVYGNDNRMPNQTLTGPTSILTQGLADERYLRSGMNVAVGKIVANTIASGEQTEAIEEFTFATGSHTKATGPSSAAFGMETESAGIASASFGLGTKAQGQGQLVLGSYNEIQGNPTQWVPTDNLFIIGKGLSETQRSNAFTVNGNGDVWIGNTLSVLGGNATGPGSFSGGEDSHANGEFSLAYGAARTQGSYAVAFGNGVAYGNYSFTVGLNVEAHGLSQTVVGTYNSIQGSPYQLANDDALFIVGNGNSETSRSNALVVKKNGDTDIYGKLTVTGKSHIRVAPSGDLSMGEFTSEPAP
jgi:hypothetical protein